MSERAATVTIDSWAGRRTYEVVVIGETPKRYRVRVVQGWRMRGRRQFYTGDVVTVPKGAVDFARATPNTGDETP